MKNDHKFLIHDERPDVPEFLLKTILSHGYKAGYAKNGNEVVAMLSNNQYDVILTNNAPNELNPDYNTQLKSCPVFVVDIKDSRNQNQGMDLKADLYLQRPILISELWQALAKPF